MSGLTVDAALEPTRRTVGEGQLVLFMRCAIFDRLRQSTSSSENFRTRLHDMWNFVGITSGSDWPLPGYPYITR